MWRSLALALVGSIAVLAACSDDPSALGSGTSGASGASGSSGDGTSGSSGASGTSTSGDSPAEICVATINDYRKSKGLPAYARWTETETCADGEAKSDGATSSAHGAFGKCMEFAQNECPGWPAPAGPMIPKCLAAMWAEGPGGGHYEAMVSTKFAMVSCGFGTAPDGAIWAVQNFR